MKELLKQWSSAIAATFAAACCLGATAALSMLTAIGAGFLINDVVLIPLYLALLALGVWLLYRSARSHENLMPFRLGLVAAFIAFAGLWFAEPLVYAALAVLAGSSAWDFWNARRTERSI